MALILVVEDDQSNSEFLEIALKKLGHDSISVDNGEKALIMLGGDRAGKFDCILMDVKLRGIDGLQTTRQLRDKNLDLPIIACTALAMVGDREKCLEAGMNDYLSKPITVEMLKVMLEKWI